MELSDTYLMEICRKKISSSSQTALNDFISVLRGFSKRPDSGWINISRIGRHVTTIRLVPDFAGRISFKPDRPDEMERVEAAGGRVINWDAYRVLGVLATSRSIGWKRSDI